LREVSIIGIGQTDVGEHWERSLRDLAVDAIIAALKDSHAERVDALYVGNMLSGEVTAQEHLGTLVADWAGFAGAEAFKVEAADASGAAAVRLAYLAVASGVHDFVLACGAEKTTDADAETTNAAWSYGTDAEYEGNQGVTVPSMAGLLLRRYLHEFGVPREDLAPFPVIAHANGANNPHAMFRSPISADVYARASMVADPISMFDVAPMCDGAAAVLLCPSEMAQRFGAKPVRIRASAAATDRLAVHSRTDPLFLQASYLSAQRAYMQAGVGPSELDLFEVHDAFSILAALSLEACGFAERGKATVLAKEGAFDLHGRAPTPKSHRLRREGTGYGVPTPKRGYGVPICTMGGLKARGHPIGASGVYQVVEIVQQLRGEAGANQLEAHLGMAQSLGGTGATAITHILEG
jgi:acetyl-CoA C-acetyltransferase